MYLQGVERSNFLNAISFVASGAANLDQVLKMIRDHYRKTFPLLDSAAIEKLVSVAVANRDTLTTTIRQISPAFTEADARAMADNFFRTVPPQALSSQVQALPGSVWREPATVQDVYSNVFIPAAVNAVGAAAPNTQPLTPNAGQPQNAPGTVIVPYASSGGVVGPLGVPTTQPPVNYLQQPPPVVVEKSELPAWAIPAAAGLLALVLIQRL